MGYTITEKILLKHTDKKDIKPSDFIYADIDLALANDITAPIAIKEFENSKFKQVFDKDKIVLVPDHFTPNKDKESAAQCRILQEFVKKHGITNYFEVGRGGIEHALLPQEGLVKPGDLVVGADSHTCTYGALGAFSTGVGSTDIASAFITGKCWFKVPGTIKLIYTGKLNSYVEGKDLILYTIGRIGVSGALYKVMEFEGKIIHNFKMDDRFTICNMAIEAGAKTGIIPPDDKTKNYISKVLKSAKSIDYFYSDKDANYSEIIEFDVSEIEPQVAFPHSPANTRSVNEIDDIKIDQIVIGSCTNGRLLDLKRAADILKGRKINKNVRLIILPATQKIYQQAIKKGYLEIFTDSGAIVSTPTCGPCIGGHMGVLGEGERALATTNRNFKGRMGHIDSEVYLCNVQIAAASAVVGRIVHPRNL